MSRLEQLQWLKENLVHNTNLGSFVHQNAFKAASDLMAISEVAQLKTHITQLIKSDLTGEYWLMTFKKIEDPNEQAVQDLFKSAPDNNVYVPSSETPIKPLD